ncbi:MAG TPA: hypothetical protein VGM94_01175 [Galbitalea sp.]|jgi:hypothetical protein
MANSEHRDINGDGVFVSYGDVESLRFVNDAGPMYDGRVGVMANVSPDLMYPETRIIVGMISRDRKEVPQLDSMMTVSEAVHLVNMLLAAITEVAAAAPSLANTAPQIVQPPVFVR